MDYGDIMIVSNKKHEVYAHLLSSLMVEKGLYDVSVINDKEYEQTKSSIRSSNPIIFVGKCTEMKKVEPNMKWKFEKYGVAYGWSGNTVIIRVQDTKVEDDFKNYIEENKEFISELNVDFTKRINSVLDKKKQKDSKGKEITKNTMIGLGVFVSFPITLPILCTLSGMKSKEIYDFKQRIVIGEFLKSGLKELFPKE